MTAIPNPLPASTSAFFRELAGGVGNFGTIVPILLGAAVASELDIAPMFFFMGIWFIISGWYYGLPIPMEPMKAIGVVAIAGGLSAGTIAGSGLVLGVLFLVLAYEPLMKGIERLVPSCVVRGLQAALAVVLIRTAFGYALDDPLVAAIGILIIAVSFLLASRYRVPDYSSLVVLALGIALGIVTNGLPALHLAMPLSVVVPTPGEIVVAAGTLVLPQIPLTIGNAILATALLAGDLYQRPVEPRRLSLTIGLMNLTSVPFGGFPMCHGAGGLAAQYRFGARGATANVMAGLVLIAVAIFFSSADLVALLPTGIFGALLVFVAIELGRHAITADNRWIVVIMAATALVFGITISFVLGILVAYLWRAAEQRRLVGSTR